MRQLLPKALFYKTSMSNRNTRSIYAEKNNHLSHPSAADYTENNPQIFHLRLSPV